MKLVNKINATVETTNPKAAKMLLIRSGLKQKELAKLINKPYTSISGALNGRDTVLLKTVYDWLTNYVEENGL
jgi:predicted transcriptional regulator